MHEAVKLPEIKDFSKELNKITEPYKIAEDTLKVKCCLAEAQNEALFWNAAPSGGSFRIRNKSGTPLMECKIKERLDNLKYLFGLMVCAESEMVKFLGVQDAAP